MSISNGSTPQWDSPFRINPDGLVAEVAQGSTEEIGGQIYNVLTCPQGAALSDPDFGIPTPLFGSLPLNTAAIVKAVQALVPGATVAAVQQQIDRLQQNPTVVDVTGTVTG